MGKMVELDHFSEGCAQPIAGLIYKLVILDSLRADYAVRRASLEN